MLLKLMNRIKKLFYLYAMYRSENSKLKKSFLKQMRYFKVDISDSGQGYVLIQMVKDYEYNIKLAAFSKCMAEKNNLNIAHYGVHINSN